MLKSSTRESMMKSERTLIESLDLLTPHPRENIPKS